MQLIGSVASPETLPPRSLSRQEKELIVKGIGRDLKDPSSIQVRWLPYRAPKNPNGMAAYCGQYNAKNSYGAYIGFKPFLAGISHKAGKISFARMIDPGGSQDTRDYAARKVCSDEGFNVDLAE